MSFLEPQLVKGEWVEVDGPAGTEWIDADLVGTAEPYQGPAIPIPESLADYCENRTVTEVKLIEGWGARLSAPGYLDCTPWTVFSTEEEAQKYLDEQADDD
jgi:hypothetical protein